MTESEIEEMSFIDSLTWLLDRYRANMYLECLGYDDFKVSVHLDPMFNTKGELVRSHHQFYINLDTMKVIK